MAANSESNAGVTGEVHGAVTTGQHLQLGIRLQPVNHSDQPVFSNFSVVQGAPGTVFIDFGFLEPSAVPAAARLVQAGGKVPETINGRLACRIAMGLDAVTQLHQQLEKHLRNLQSRAHLKVAPKEPLS